jgi:hypothetical protein
MSKKFCNIDHIDQGIKSGYPICCIVWFLLRTAFSHFIIRITNKQPWYYGQPARGNVQHVQCPVCNLITNKDKLKYYYCKKRDWIQYKKEICSLCVGHDTHLITQLNRPIYEYRNGAMHFIGFSNE